MNREHSDHEMIAGFGAWADITKYHSLGNLNNRDLFSHNSEGYKSEIRASAGLFSPGASLLGL